MQARRLSLRVFASTFRRFDVARLRCPHIIILPDLIGVLDLSTIYDR
jgi:hypothetical protein